MTNLLWPGAAALATIGTALVFAGVTLPGLFLPGVVCIDAGLLTALAAGALTLGRTASPD
jgi:hypothetical protein